MKEIVRYLAIVIIFAFFISGIWASQAYSTREVVDYFPFDEIPSDVLVQSPDTGDVNLQYPFDDEDEYPVNNFNDEPSGLDLRRPSNISTTVEFDPVTGQYVFKQKIGDLDYRRPSSMTISEYQEYNFNKSAQDYFRQRARGESFANQSSLIPKLHVGGEIFDHIFGSNTINIQPQGSAELIFGVNIQKTDNPSLPVKLRRTTTFDFQEKIQMNVTGQIGDKMRIQTNYNTESTFEFENKMNLRYEGKEDEIIQIIEAGDVTLPLSGTLITGSQSLFGIKTELQFGKLRMTTVFSQQKGESSQITVEGGAQLQDFEVWGDEYEANKHFFLSQYFKDHYDESLRNMPIITSGVTINKVEVWVTNKSGNFTEARNLVAFLDLGEARYANPTNPDYGLYTGNSNIFNEIIATPDLSLAPYPNNNVNDLYKKMSVDYVGIRDVSQVSTILGTGYFVGEDFLSGQDYEKVEKARKLNQSEYTINNNLGYISLNSALNTDEVLAVAFEYTIQGKTYKVGEFSSEAPADPNALILKLLKGTYLSPTIKFGSPPKTRINPTWELMMKNIYAIGAYQVNPQDFMLNVMYQNDLTGTSINYIAEGPKAADGGINGMPLLQALNLDNLNSNLDPSPDGFFDFVTGVTINPSNGRIIFPVLQPFGSYLREKITGGNPDFDAIAEKYVYEELYDSTKTTAANQAEKNKFYLAGTYQSSSSSEISLNALNVPQGSVKVTAGGMQLTENQDYTVDYTLGRVKIINAGLLESGTPISISLESNSMFNIQSKTLLGTHLDYRFNQDFNVGATILNLTERPLTSKVNIGDEPISNTIWGFDANYRTDVPFLTKMVDWLPFIETKEKSSITAYGEFAQLIPGHSKAIDKNGVSYIDDFEGSKTSIDIKTIGAWVLASTPQMQDNLFPEAKLNNNLAYGFNRARLAWYNIDPLFLRNNNTTPGHIANDADQQSSHFVREIFEKEIFPNKETPNGIPTNIPVLNLAYYPSERGQYNYETGPSAYSDGLKKDGSGLLENPKSRWGGIMRKIETSDFESANIEFIEFWVMDPFAEDADSSHTGGNLYFNLGNISEDILKDSRKAFENGYPTSDDPALAFVDTTAWGRVPLVQSLVNAFDNNIDGRPYQDIGFDGLSSQFGQEQGFFTDFLAKIDSLYNIGELNQAAYDYIKNDPSNDDYHYFRGGDYDAAQVSILDRYKRFNSMEGNSPATEQSSEAYPTTATNIPDAEDINRDNTLSEGESYYQYVVPFTYQNLRHDRKYINDVVTASVTLKNGKKSEVKWYQFKIPVYEPDKVVGSISDFKSIRFMRLFLRDFDEDVILRFAKMDLVRGEWRKYNLSLRGPGEYEPTPQPIDAAFDVSAVNIEENGSRTPVNYVLPPGIDRVIDPTNPQLRQLNEQSIVLSVQNLEDGDARAAYRSVDMDIRQYKRLKMEVHAEALSDILNDDDLRVFIRLGSDYKANFYEYEVPLKLTEPGYYDNDDNADRQLVWPDINRIDISLEAFQTVKQLRNDANRADPINVNITSPFSIFDEDKLGDDQLPHNKVTIMGNPNLSNIRTIMIGIRNPKANSEFADDWDDGLPKSGEVWLNELRLTDFDENGGWAANARIMAKLADFGNVTIAGSTSKPGFGSIEKKVSERSKEETYAYDISSNLELGKFFPEESGVRIPMYVGISESVSNPEYNPLDPDIPFDIALDNAANKHDRDSIKHAAQDYTRRKSLNFTNVQIAKQGVDQPKIYDISNFSVSYAYSEIFSRNINTEYNLQKNYRGGLAYNYSTRPTNVSPFKKSSGKLMKSKAMRLVKDFNFYYLPQQIAFRSDLNRDYQAVQLRNISTSYLNNADVIIPPTYNKNFTWNRQYDLKYDLSRSIKMDFSATNQARIDEPDGIVDKEGDKEVYQAWRDSVWQSVKNFGRTTQYSQMVNINWNVPINRLPLLEWATLSTRYNATYDWTASPILSDTITLGNTIKNSSTSQFNGQANLLTIYNKVPYLKEINQKYSGRGGGSRGRGAQPKSPKGKGAKEGEEEDDGETEHVEYTKDGVSFKANIPKSINHALETEDVQVTVYDSLGNRLFGQQKIVNENRVTYKIDKDMENARVSVKGRKKVRPNYLKIIFERSVAFMMSVKNLSISYSFNNGTILPGYLPETKFFGSENYEGGGIAPGVPFILGWQDDQFAVDAADRGWLSTDPTLNSPFTMNSTQTINLRSSIQPIESMRIDVTANRSFSENVTEFYLADENGDFTANSRKVTGNFSMSFGTWGTAFEKLGDDYSSEIFQKFKDSRITIAERLRNERFASDPTYAGAADDDGYPDGYGLTSQEVLIPAFLSAYGKIDPNKITLDVFPTVWHLKPNWRVTWDGLSKVELVQKYFKTVSIGHTYRSTYNVGSYNTNLDFVGNEDGFSMTRDLLNNFLPQQEINSVSINEQFSPLINFDLTWNNSLTTKLEVKKTRNLTLAFSNQQLTEVRSQEYVIGAGYRIQDLKLYISGKEFKSDLTMRIDFSLRQNWTILRQVADLPNQTTSGLQRPDQITSGQRIIGIKFNADYVLSERFNVRFFTDYSNNKPYVSLSFPTSNTSIGFSIRFTLM